MIKLCKDCKHNCSVTECCHHYNTVKVTDPVLGGTKELKRRSCKEHRNADKFKAAWFNLCGKEGYWFEKKELSEKV